MGSTDYVESEMKNSIAAKLNPDRFPMVSGEFWSCLGALLNQRFTEPRLASITSTTDGWLLGRIEGDIGFNESITDYASFERVVLKMAQAARDLSEEDCDFLETLLWRVKSGIETTSGMTATQLSHEALTQSRN
ncbi:MAG: hypothetical protein ABJA67_03225 [Chthonomonadales bacterium]